FPLSFIGSCLGSYTITLIPSDFLRPLVVVLLIVIAVYTLRKKTWGDRMVYTGMTRGMAAAAALLVYAIGFYDGFFGSGTGSFLIFLMIFAGFDFIRAAGNAKVLNFGSSLGALITFGALGHVHVVFGIAMGLSMVAGALV